MANYCARDFTEAVTVEKQTLADDGFGGKTQTWSTRVTIYCKVEDSAGAETFQAGRNATQGQATFTTPYNPDIVSTDRLVLDSVYYNIRSIVDVDRKRRWLRIVADFGSRN